MKTTTTVSRRRASRLAWSGLTTLVLLFAVTAAPLAATPRMEPFAYHSVVADKPFAPFTADLQSTSPLAYHSVVADKPFAPFTADLQSTSLLAYHSVVADKPFAPFTADLKRTSMLPYYSVLH